MKPTPFDDFAININYFVFRRCKPDWNLTPWRVRDYDITYIIEGGAKYTLDGAVYELQAGDLVFLTNGIEKEAFTNAKKPMSCFAVNFNLFAVNDKTSVVKNVSSASFPMISHIGLHRDLIDMFREMAISWTEQQYGYILKSKALLMLILNRLSEIVLFNIDSAPSDYRIKKITRHISEHFSEKLMVKALAGMINLNTSYFGSLFKQETGMTVHQYLKQIRVRNAENMLQSGNYKVHEVAEHCGFSDVFHFFKSFKSLRGFPPSRCIPKDSEIFSGKL